MFFVSFLPLAPLVFALQLIAPRPENWAYVSCITTEAGKIAQERVSNVVFRSRLNGSCQNERAALRRAIVQQQVASGRTLTQASSEADGFFEEIMKQMLSLQPVKRR